MVTPCVLQTATLLFWPDGGLPAIGVPESVATSVYYTSARETHEFGLQVSQCLCQVLTEPVSFIGVLWHQRYHIDVYHTRVENEHLQDGILAVLAGRQHSLVLLPVLAVDIDGCFS